MSEPKCECGHIWLYHRKESVLKASAECCENDCTCKAYTPKAWNRRTDSVESDIDKAWDSFKRNEVPDGLHDKIVNFADDKAKGASVFSYNRGEAIGFAFAWYIRADSGDIGEVKRVCELACRNVIENYEKDLGNNPSPEDLDSSASVYARAGWRNYKPTPPQSATAALNLLREIATAFDGGALVHTGKNGYSCIQKIGDLLASLEGGRDE